MEEKEEKNIDKSVKNPEENIINKTENNNQKADSGVGNKIEEKTENSIKESKEKQKLRTINIFSIILKVLITTIVLLTLVFSIRAVVYKKYDVFGYRFHVILSGSMEDSIFIHDMVITKDNSYDLKVGDVIAFGSENGASVHRIVNIDTQNGETVYRTKGDNNNCEDRELVRNSDIVGKVVGVIPKVGGIVLFLKANLVIILIIIIAITISTILIRRLFEIGRGKKE